MSKLFSREQDGYPSSYEAKPVYSSSPYWLHLRWVGSDGVIRYKIEANQEVIDWLTRTDPNRKNWWPINGRININEVLYIHLALKFK
jgi:hypothetical protein